MSEVDVGSSRGNKGRESGESLQRMVEPIEGLVTVKVAPSHFRASLITEVLKTHDVEAMVLADPAINSPAPYYAMNTLCQVVVREEDLEEAQAILEANEEELSGAVEVDVDVDASGAVFATPTKSEGASVEDPGRYMAGRPTWVRVVGIVLFMAVLVIPVVWAIIDTLVQVFGD